jgi:hypothetical protein
MASKTPVSNPQSGPQAVWSFPQASGAVAVLPDGIEIFRSGRHIDDAGNVHSFSDADVDGMVVSYDPAKREAPLTVGHPKDNLPAYGWVKELVKTASGALAMTSHQVEPQFAEMVTAGRFKKRSASFYPPSSPNNPTPGKWYLRHVAFLGAQPPAIAGLKDIQFSEDDAGGAVSFSETVTAEPSSQEQDDMSKELEEKLAKAQKDLEAANAATAAANATAAAATKKASDAEAQAASFAEKARADRKAGFVSFAEAQVKAGTLLPKDKDMAVATLEALADSAPVEFADGYNTSKVRPYQWLQDLISNGKPAVSFGEFAGGKLPAGAGAAKGKSDAEIDQAAKAYASAHKVNYAEALNAVTASFTA